LASVASFLAAASFSSSFFLASSLSAAFFLSSAESFGLASTLDLAATSFFLSSAALIASSFLT